MDITAQQIAELEKSYYEAIVPVAKVTPGLSLSFRNEVILTSNENLPDISTTHACLLRSSLEDADDLIEEIIDYFKMRNLPKTVFISRACTPTDIGRRLVKRGFIRHKEEEAWLVLETLQALDSFSPAEELCVKEIDENGAFTFAEVMLTASGLSTNLAPLVAQSMVPSIAIPEMCYFLGFVEDKPIASCSLIQHHEYAVMSEINVIPEYQDSEIGVSIGVTALRNMHKRGVENVISQAPIGTVYEKYLHALGFKRAFTRVMYMLS
ncbi:MAG: hypothetical protein KDJ65_36320 [Anaerolineae bacterium]|nr:hypothetical protein [Anaerolineae bacterium]